ncbi:MAG: AI-2E family transporter [Eubacterium sp.]|nr:AI-2E family transporter [Eubacterium sp.]
MKFKKEWLKNKWVENALALCIGVLFFVLLWNFGAVFGVIGRIFKFITPVIIGAAIAYIIDPLARLFEHHLFGKLKKWQLRRMLAVTVALILILVLVVTLMVYLVPQLVDSIKQFVENLDGYSASLKKFISGLSDKLKINLSGVNDFLDNLVSNVVKWIGDNKELILNKGLDFGSGLITFLLGAILAIYFLFGKYFILAGGKRFFRAAMPAERYHSTMSFFNRCNQIMTRYVACDVLDGIIIGVVNGIFMAIMGMPYVILISVVVGVTNLAPTFGPLVGAVIGGLILVLVNPLYALIFLVFTLVLQTIDGYVIKPKLFGDSLGVSSVMILVFIILGGRMFGILGVLLSIPIAAIVDFSYHDFILARLERKRGISDGEVETPEAESKKSMQELSDKEQDREERREERKEQRKTEKEQEKQAKEQERQEHGERPGVKGILDRLKRDDDKDTGASDKPEEGEEDFWEEKDDDLNPKNPK